MSINGGIVIRSLEEKYSKEQPGKDGTQDLLDPVVGLSLRRRSIWANFNMTGRSHTLGWNQAD